MIATVALFVLMGAASCGGSEDSAESTKSPSDRSAPTKSTDPADAAAAYVGLTKAAAIARAKAEQRPWRIGREDDEQFMLTQDFVENRVTFEIDDGKVTKATLG